MIEDATLKTPRGAPDESVMTTVAKARVLLADDEPALLRSYRRVLHRAGYEVEVVEDATAGIDMFKTGAFDVVISDIAMPGMSGLEMLREIHAHDRDTPVLLMTAGPNLEGAIKAVEYGALRYLTKPVSEDTLLDCVSRAVEVRSRTRRSNSQAAIAEQTVVDRATLDAAFDRMLGGLWMAVQPIISWSAHSTVAVEALMRSNEPILPHPGAILCAAEQLNRLNDLGRTVRRRIAAIAASLPFEADIYVNLHPADIGDDDLFDPSAPLSKIASRVVLEITERSSLAKVPDVLARIRALRTLGYRVAIDDLGAGYAGLNSFTSLEPDVVKLDMGLVRGVDTSATKQKIIGSIVSLCRELKIEVIAEGIEIPAERDALLALSVDKFQGYHFARPAKPTPDVNWS